jgi:NitT/TauT family transport system substrate-binding protein
LKSILLPSLCAWILATFGASPCAAAPASLSVGYTNTSSFTGLFIAKDRGLFAKHGLDVTLVLIALNSTIPSALVGGSIQIGGTTPPVFLRAQAGGLDVVVVAGGAVNDVRNKVGAGVLGRVGADIKTAKDFEGRRVGVPGLGAYMDVLFRRWLKEHGADDKKVRFVEVPLAQSLDILRSGNVDAMLVGEPFYSRVLHANAGYLIAPYLTEMPDGLFAVYFSSTRDWATTHAAEIRAFRDALSEANAFASEQPEAAREIVARATHLPADVVATMVLPTLRLTVPTDDLHYWADTLVAQGMIRQLPNAELLVMRP